MQSTIKERNLNEFETTIRPLHPYLSKLIGFGENGSMPISPHLTIYQTQLSSVSSVSYRFAGIFLLLLSFIFFSFEFFWDYSIFYRSLFYFFNSENDFFLAIIFFFCLLFSYHILNGLRHLLFDLGQFVSWGGFVVSTYGVFVVSVFLSIAIWLDLLF